MSDVKLLAAWDGWCDPCAAARPLALTEHGQRGVRAWLAGVGPEDRGLHLTCRLCGQYQVVPRLEADDPEVETPAPSLPLILATALRPARTVVVSAHPASAAPAPLITPDAPVPAPRQEVVLTPRQSAASMLSLLAAGLDVVGAGQRRAS